MANEENNFEIEFNAIEEKINAVIDKIHKLVDERKERLLKRLNDLKISYGRNCEAESAMKQLQQFRDAGANLLTSNLLENSKVISLEVIDKQIESWKQKQASMKIHAKHELKWNEFEVKNALNGVDLILTDPCYSKRNLPTYSTCKQGHEEGDISVPFYIALVEEENEVYIADSGNHRIAIHNMEGEFLRQFNKTRVESPRGIAVTNEAVFVTDNIQHALYKFNHEGEISRKIKKQGEGRGAFLNPCAVACKYSYVYVCDFNNNRIQIFDEDLKLDRIIANKEFGYPSDILFSKKYFYVLSTVNNAIFQYTNEERLIRTIRLIGQSAPINEAYFFARDKHKNFLISDKYAECIKVFSREGNYKETLGEGNTHYPRGLAVTEDCKIIHVCENKEGAFQIY
ncbi:NHL repeat containing protein [Oopsacas minuta]|uniref:NHL repeat containing protein n=1 Tax=Oopsacas minuta TaxID=111878 RepID=A0AAV7KH30_9METZ|nr:NHL repeat containing protein [Oopsacas minuta]